MDRKRYQSFTFRNTDDQKILESDWYKGIASTLNQDCYQKCYLPIMIISMQKTKVVN